jgi:hypothetical protein
MRLLRLGSLLLLMLAFANPAAADATAFIGTLTNPNNRTVSGFTIGGGLLFLGFEFEYAHAGENASDGTPQLRTGMGNVLLQTPFAIAGFQPYFATGGGAYRETLGLHEETNFAGSTGGGVKINLIGPFRARVDYRVFRLHGDALYSPVHRFYVGVNLKF